MLQLSESSQLEALALKQGAHNDVLVPEAPDWFISCGLGTGAPEVKSCRALWPSTKILGADPDPKVIESLRSTWRSEDVLLEIALADSDGEATASFRDGPSYGTLHPRIVATDQQSQSVQTTSLTTLDTRYGPFTRTVLWVDAEGYDYKILLGAEPLFRRGTVLALVTEVWTARPDLLKRYSEMRTFLFSFGFHMVDILNPSWWGHNEIYLCDQLSDRVIEAG